MAECKTCTLWDYKNAQDSLGRINPKKSAKCLWVPTYPLPNSAKKITVYFDTHTTYKENQPMMKGTEGQRCPYYRKNIFLPSRTQRIELAKLDKNGK